MAKSREDIKIQELFEAAHKDRHLKLRLLDNPKKVAKEWGIELGPREAERLTKLGAFVELANEVKFGRVWRCDPKVCYPSTVWLRQELIDLLEGIIRPDPDWIKYPPPPLRRIAEHRLNRNLGLLRSQEGGVITDR
ncbi:MAG: hypothetical protein JSU70_10220 [Phycisphaerales bacterium]|nr:MAG: hypothetical protein JSU70_10220 [Phycisphaerales bacterium]